MLKEEQVSELFKELRYQTSRSGGKGGQNVNKVETRVELIFDVTESTALKEEQKRKVLEKYPALIEERIIRISASTHRSQSENKQAVKEKLINLLEKLLKPEKKRIATKPGKAAKRKKQEDKRKLSEKKSNRQRPIL